MIPYGFSYKNALVKNPLVNSFLPIRMSERCPIGEGPLLTNNRYDLIENFLELRRDYLLSHVSSLSLIGSITNRWVVMRLAVIPARGGSKRIPRKNFREFSGKPIIAWSIEAALQSKCFDRVIVSTDDEEIADVARSFGAEIPFLRPVKLADDYTGTAAVVRHAIMIC